MPDIEAQAEPIPILRCEAQRRYITRVSDISNKICFLDAEEALEHKAAFRRAEVFRDDGTDISRCLVLPVQRVYAVFAVVVGVDGNGYGVALFGKGNFLFEHGVLARNGRDKQRIIAVREASRYPSIAVSALGRLVVYRTVGKHNFKIFRRARKRFRNGRIDGIRAARLFKHGCKRMAAFACRKGVGVHIVLARRAGNRRSVYAQRSECVLRRGRKRNGDLAAEGHAFRYLDRAARNAARAVDGYGNARIGGAEAEQAVLQDRGFRKRMRYSIPFAQSALRALQFNGLDGFVCEIRVRIPRGGCRGAIAVADVQLHPRIVRRLRIYAEHVVLHHDGKVHASLFTHPLVHAGGAFLRHFELHVPAVCDLDLLRAVAPCDELHGEHVFAAVRGFKVQPHFRREAEVVRNFRLRAVFGFPHAQEAREHKRIGCAEVFQQDLASVVAPCNFARQRVFALCAVVFGGDGKGKRFLPFAELHLLRKHDVPARNGRDRCRIGAVRNSRCLPCVFPVCRQLDLVARGVGKGNGKAVFLVKGNAACRYVERKVSHFAQDDRNGMAALFRRKGVGVCAFAFFAGNGFPVHLQAAQLIVRFGHDRNGDAAAEGRVLRYIDLAARNGFASVDGNGYGDIRSRGAKAQRALYLRPEG